MPKVIEGGHHDVSVGSLPGRVELRIHGRSGSGLPADFVTHLKPADARSLAYALVAEAERLEAATGRI
jgi:hypothetical protein